MSFRAGIHLLFIFFKIKQQIFYKEIFLWYAVTVMNKYILFSNIFIMNIEGPTAPAESVDTPLPTEKPGEAIKRALKNAPDVEGIVEVIEGIEDGTHEWMDRVSQEVRDTALEQIITQILNGSDGDAISEYVHGEKAGEFQFTSKETKLRGLWARKAVDSVRFKWPNGYTSSITTLLSQPQISTITDRLNISFADIQAGVEARLEGHEEAKQITIAEAEATVAEAARVDAKEAAEVKEIALKSFVDDHFNKFPDRKTNSEWSYTPQFLKQRIDYNDGTTFFDTVGVSQAEIRRLWESGVSYDEIVLALDSWIDRSTAVEEEQTSPNLAPELATAWVMWGLTGAAVVEQEQFAEAEAEESDATNEVATETNPLPRPKPDLYRKPDTDWITEFADAMMNGTPAEDRAAQAAIAAMGTVPAVTDATEATTVEAEGWELETVSLQDTLIANIFEENPKMKSNTNGTFTASGGVINYFEDKTEYRNNGVLVISSDKAQSLLKHHWVTVEDLVVDLNAGINKPESGSDGSSLSMASLISSPAAAETSTPEETEVVAESSVNHKVDFSGAPDWVQEQMARIDVVDVNNPTKAETIWLLTQFKDVAFSTKDGWYPHDSAHAIYAIADAIVLLNPDSPLVKNDAWYWSNIKAALKDTQAELWVTADGVPGPNTIKAMIAKLGGASATVEAAPAPIETVATVTQVPTPIAPEVTPMPTPIETKTEYGRDSLKAAAPATSEYIPPVYDTYVEVPKWETSGWTAQAVDAPTATVTDDYANIISEGSSEASEIALPKWLDIVQNALDNKIDTPEIRWEAQLLEWVRDPRVNKTLWEFYDKIGEDFVAGQQAELLFGYMNNTTPKDWEKVALTRKDLDDAKAFLDKQG